MLGSGHEIAVCALRFYPWPATAATAQRCRRGRVDPGVGARRSGRARRGLDDRRRRPPDRQRCARCRRQPGLGGSRRGTGSVGRRCAVQAAHRRQPGRTGHRRRRSQPGRHGAVARGGPGARRRSTARPRRGGALAVFARTVLPAQMGDSRRGRHAGREQLLALRALANRPLRRLTAVSPDPVGTWRREDPAALRALATLELRSAGVAVRNR